MNFGWNRATWFNRDNFSDTKWHWYFQLVSCPTIRGRLGASIESTRIILAMLSVFSIENYELAASVSLKATLNY